MVPILGERDRRIEAALGLPAEDVVLEAEFVSGGGQVGGTIGGVVPPFADRAGGGYPPCAAAKDVVGVRERPPVDGLREHPAECVARKDDLRVLVGSTGQVPERV